jgi:K319-like protein
MMTTRKLRTALAISFLLVCLIAATNLWGQLGNNTPNAPFDMIGFIQDAKLASGCDPVATPLCGGTITVNGITITVPANTILQMPATGISWGELFSMNPMGVAGETGLAMLDTTPVVDTTGTVPPGFRPTYEAHVQGNIVNQQYIAGLIFLSQQSLNSGQGWIDNIQYPSAPGGVTEIRVSNGLANGNTIRLKINTPNGRYGPVFSPDPRFTADEDNPTIAAESGYPMCLPRTDVTNGVDDPLCPQALRPLDPSQPGGTSKNVTYPPINISPLSMYMAPMEPGDYITWNGNLYYDSTGPYIAVHTIQASLGLYTFPGSDPVYVQEQDILQGAGSPVNPPVPVEGTSRIVMIGFSTDPTRSVTIGGVDIDCNGNEAFRTFTANFPVDPGPPTGAKKGRVQLRSLGGPFLPPAHYMRTKVDGAVPTVTANGLTAGVYTAPQFDFIFSEAINLGALPPLLNFEDLPFLTNGEGPWRGNTNNVIGQLNPWPGPAAPTPTCIYTPPPPPPPPPTAPVANAGTDQSVASGAAVTLDGSASTPAGSTFFWQQTAGTLVALSNASAVKPTFTAPNIPSNQPAAVLTFQLTVSNSAGTSSASVNITVQPAPPSAPPTANAGTNQTVVSAQQVTLSGSGTDPNNLALTYKWSQVSGPSVTFNPVAANTATVTFIAPTVAIGSPPVTLVFQLVVTNSSNIPSQPSQVTVTVKSPADIVTITQARYRANKGRLDVTASSSVISPNITLTCVLDLINSVTGKPISAVMTNALDGTYTVTIIGIAQPHVVTVNSSAGGTASTTAIQLR